MSNTQPQTLSLAAAFQQAVAHHQAGRLQAAEQLYRAILQTEPNHPDVNHNLGVIAAQVGQPLAGLPYLKAAVTLKPTNGQYAQSYAEILLETDQVAAALTFIRSAMQHGINTSAMQTLLQMAEVAELNPAAGAAPTATKVNQLAALFNAARHADVEVMAQQLIGEYPNFGFAWKALGASQQVQGKDSLAALQKAADLLPDDPEARSNLGNALWDLGQLDIAVLSYRRALQINPDYAEAHSNLGNALRDLGQFDEAASSHRRALRINPHYAEAHSNLGNLLRDLGQFDEAVLSCRRALQIKPDFAEAHSHLGNALRDLGQFDEAASSYRQALQIKPDDLVLHTALLHCVRSSETVDAHALFNEHCRFGEQFEGPLRNSWPLHANVRDPDRRLQVGFVSGDLNNHPITNFIEPVLAQLATSYPQLSLHAYYNQAVEDQVTHRLKEYFTHWHPIVSLSDEALAQKIRADGIDILIDLSGHTSKNRLAAFARKPTPVQATWMGFPGTTGLQAMDYYFTDRFFLPPGQFDDQFTEKLVQLPASAPFLPFAGAPPVNGLPALHNGYVTFGSFNRPNKITRSVIALWAKTLRALPDSHLLLGGMPQGEHTPMMEWFALEGIARERLSIHPRSDMKTYLALHHQVDICLDTFPYNGGTTTLHALSMGVPTLTLTGQAALSRTGASILGHVGLESFLAHNAEEFVQNALSWAGNLEVLAGIRIGLRQRFNLSAMGQPAVVTAGLERALRIMWQRWCNNLPAQSFEVPKHEIEDAISESKK